jgi:acyl-CoA thioester hydrolase
MKVHKTEVRSIYKDTDQMKFVYHGKYVEFFEIGRTELLRDAGLTYKEIEKLGFFMPVREVFIKYKNPAFYDELLVIESRINEMPAAKIHIDHVIRSKERDAVIVEGYVELAIVNSQTMRPTRAPQMFLDVIKSYYEL